MPQIKNVSRKDIITTEKNNDQLAKIMSNQINSAIKNKSAEELVPKIQSLIKSYFSEPFQVPQGTIREILYVNQPVASAADITYWNQQAKSGFEKTSTYTHNLHQKLETTIEGLIQAKNSGKKGNSESFKKAVKNTKANVSKIISKYDRAGQKLSAKEAALKKAIKNNKAKSNNQDQAALDESLEKIEDYLKIIDETQGKLEVLSKKLDSL